MAKVSLDSSTIALLNNIQCTYFCTTLGGTIAGASVLVLTALGQIAGLSLPLCIIIAGTIIMLYLIWEYRPITAQYNPMERMEASMLAIKVIDDKQCSSLYTAVMLKSPPCLDTLVLVQAHCFMILKGSSLNRYYQTRPERLI